MRHAFQKFQFRRFCKDLRFLVRAKPNYWSEKRASRSHDDGNREQTKQNIVFKDAKMNHAFARDLVCSTLKMFHLWVVRKN